MATKLKNSFEAADAVHPHHRNIADLEAARIAIERQAVELVEARSVEEGRRVDFHARRTPATQALSKVRAMVDRVADWKAQLARAQIVADAFDARIRDSVLGLSRDPQMVSLYNVEGMDPVGASAGRLVGHHRREIPVVEAELATAIVDARAECAACEADDLLTELELIIK